MPNGQVQVPTYLSQQVAAQVAVQDREGLLLVATVLFSWKGRAGSAAGRIWCGDPAGEDSAGNSTCRVRKNNNVENAACIW